MTVERAGVSEAILDLCDSLLGEVGRRMHRFAWLKDPAAPVDSHLPLDAYYPGHRLVVVCHRMSAERERACREQVPVHGLRLLSLDPERLDGSRAEVSNQLNALIGALGPAPQPLRAPVRPRAPEPVRAGAAQPALAGAAQPALAGAAQPARSATPEPVGFRSAAAASRAAATASAEMARAAVTGSRMRALELPPRGPGGEPPAFRRGTREAQERSGLFLGAMLVAVLTAETLGLVVAVGILGGHPVLAVAFGLDVVARALGTVGGARDGDDEVAWSCLLFGSPAVVGYAMSSDERLRAEPMPLAGTLGGAALVLLALALLAAIVGA